MKKISKKSLTVISIISIIVSLLFPFLIADKDDSLLSIFSTSFTLIGTIIALITLYIAIILYQKFGLESRFVERRADKVLELVDILKGRYYTVRTEDLKYFLRFGVDDYETLNKEPFYTYMKNKILLMDKKDYEVGIKEIVNIGNSYWLPSEIKEKLKFFDINVFLNEKIEKKDEKYAEMMFNSEISESKDWSLTQPEITVDEFVKYKNELSSTIEKWLSEHCDIKLDLELNKRNQL